MAKQIWFDMDGTIAELYKVKDWLKYFELQDRDIYSICLPRNKFQEINETIEALAESGWEVGVITWASRTLDPDEPQEDYNLIYENKLNWLCKYFPALVLHGHFYCIPYGMDKTEMVHDTGDVIYLVDDNKEVRKQWRSKGEHYRTINASRSFLRELQGLVG